MAAGTGILLPRARSSATGALTAVVIGGTDDGEALFAAGGLRRIAGGFRPGIMLRAWRRNAPCPRRWPLPRLHHGNRSAPSESTTTMPAATVAALRRLGYAVREVGALGRVNALHCPGRDRRGRLRDGRRSAPGARIQVE